ncbi:Cna B-type domain-containing protein [Streptococcus periodonticum]|uniref:Cna B-type domain-containing protein n=2 Tax=Streptococcus TaxID=1301 RepID=A0A3S9MTD1_9STRE|nr:Cna B-type domain-containing protein [Streptococcus periodonticum]AZQ42430.1 Cna B-type domain-containing protein [Streptococcus periodonticum]
MKAKRWIGFFLSLLTIFTVLGFWNVQRVSAADVTSKVKIDNLKITIASTGSETEGIHGSNDTSMNLKYSGEFSFPNVAANEIKNGDYFIVKAPDNLSLKDGSLDLIDSTSHTQMGTVQVNNANHQLVFTFNEKVEGKQNIRGNFVAEATETLKKEGKTVTYVLPDGKKQTITYKVNKYEKTDVIGETITKYGYNDNNKAIAHFQMKINRAKKDMTGHVVKITDDVSKEAFASYIEGTFSMHEVEFETTNTNSSALKHIGDKYEITTDPKVYKADSDKKALLTFVNGKRGFELLMPTNMGTKSFFLTYDTSSPADTSTISNSAQYLIDNQPQLIWEKYGGSTGTKTEATFNLKTVKSVGASVTADIAGKIKITKFDKADAAVKLAGVVFEIIRKSDGVKVQEVTTDADGIAVSNHLNDGKYIVKEKTPKSGYQVNSQEFEVEMKGGKGVPLNISNKRVTVDFEATKTWVGGKKTDYKEVKLGLYVHKKGQTVADSKPVSGNYTPEVTESNGVYTYEWKNQLPKYDVDGTTELVYSVRELQDQTDLPLQEGEKVKVGENNYVVSYNADKTQVTNTYEVPKTNVTAKKVWVGGQERVRPTTYFKLYRTLEGGTEEAAPNAELKKVPTTDGTVKWTGLPATDQNAKKYTYSVKEVDDKGELITKVDGYTPSQIDPLTIKNTYSASPAEAVIEAKKKLEGRPTELQDEEFEFILKDNDGKEVQRIKNKGTNADGTGRVVFNPIKFTKEGHYQYTIVEAKAGETENGITYDNRTVPVIVHVYDNGRGQLVAWVEKFEISQVALPAADFSTSAPGSNLVPPISGAINTITDAGIQTFTNTYKATKVKVPVAATKSFINKNTDKPIQFQGGEFEFALFEKNGTDPIQTTTNDATGNIKFEDLEFNKADTYHYTIVEKNAGTTDKGITYSNKTIEVTIKVVDNGKGALEATVTYDNNDSTFENTYKAENAKAVLEVDKKLSNRNLEANMFEFTLTDQVGNVEKAKNGADGKVKFSELTFDEAGTYTYTIKEVKAGTTENGITYDAKTVTAKVTVTDDGQGKLHAAVEYSSDGTANSTTFNNVYTPAGDTSVTLGAKKVLEGKTLEAGKYSFVLKKADGTVVETVTNAADGTVTFSPISYNESQVGTHKYTISEIAGTETGITYDKTVQEVEVTVEKVSATELKATASKEAKDLVFTNKYTPAGDTSITLGAKKVLEGKTLEAGKYSFVLKKADGTVVETVTNATDGTVTFSPISYNESQVGTHKYTISEVAGSEAGITYDKTVREVEVKVEKISATELKATVSKEAKDLVFTNKYTPAPATKVKIAGKKVLEGKTLEAGKYSFVLKKADGTVVETVTNAADGTVTFSPISYNESQVGTHKYTISEVAGSEAGITYDKTVREVEVKVEKISATELKATVSKEAKDLVFTNKYTPAPATKVKIAGKKVLEGKTLEAGKYSFVLKKADGTVVETVTNAADGTVTFSPISYDESQVGTHKYTISEVAGSEAGITYDKTVREVEVKVEKISATELKATVSKEAKDLVFTNKYTPAKMQIPVKKIWDDADNQDGKRPTKITVKLLADGQDTDKTLELSEANGWAGNFTDLDADKGGAPIDYKVVEVSSVAGYTTEISGDAKTGFTITNKYTPETIDIKATKNWDDANNQDGKRPKYITVNLLADGEKVASKEVKAAADGTWSTVFTKLPKFKAGKVIKYSLTEEVVSEYTSEINDFNITNKYTPKMIDYQVTKTWNDNNNQDGKRPDHITVHLMKTVGGVTTEVEKYDIKVAEADPANGNVWKHTFTNLPKYEAGQEIVYSVKEDAVAGYETSIKGQEITNTHEPETIVISGKKVWEDANNQDGKRTATVKVQILKGKEIVDEIETSEEKGWAFESKPLPKYENGQEIKYDVKEVAVESYEKPIVEKSQDGKYTITNKRTPEKVNLTGQKTWNDANNQDNIRPTEIKVRLLADGKDTGKMATASAATGWKYSFEGLDRYKDGKEIVYSVKEVKVPEGYTSEPNGMNLTNNHIPATTSVSGQKTWEDENDKDGLRPKEIQVKLLANGKDTGKVATVSEATGWKYSFEKLAKYEAGKEITYTVEEVSVPEGYTAKVDGMNITNRHTPEKPQIPQTPPSTPEKSKKKILPSTGSQNSFFALLAGLFTLSGAAYLLKKKA